jgi:hypothetical protein
MAGLFARKCRVTGACQWFKRQVVGREVWLGLTKEGQIIATFPNDSANFYAQTRSAEDIADFLLIVLTYGVSEVAPAPDKSEVRQPRPK